ncbi:MAG: hypothetical protein U1A78_31480 [Polyangia bacterium]
MNSQIQSMLVEAEGRYLTAAEQTTLREFASRIDERLTAMAEVESKESAIIEQTMKDLLRAYPDFEKKYASARSKGGRDLALALRYSALAMVRGDSQFLHDALLLWMGTMLRGLGMAPQFIEDAYKAMERVTSRELTPKTAELLRPFIQQCGRELSGAASS